MNKNLFLIRNLSSKFLKGLVNPKDIFFYLNAYALNILKEKRLTDAYVVSYPKCGRTWLRMMYATYIQASYSISSFSPILMKKYKNIQYVNFTHDQSDWLPAPKHYLKIQQPNSDFLKCPVVFIARDPRDVIVSSYMHLRFREKLYNKSISDFIYDEHVGIKKIVSFYNQWAEQINNYKVTCILYEEMHSAPIQQLEIFLHAIGIKDIDVNALEQAVEFSQFDRMKRMEKSNKWNIPWLKAGNPEDERSFKTRKGKIGEYNEVLSAQDIEYINRIMRENLAYPFNRYNNS